MIGAEHGWRWRHFAQCARDYGDSRGRCRFGAFLVDFYPGFVEDAGYVEEPGSVHAGEIGFAAEGVAHAHLDQRVVEAEGRLHFESWDEKFDLLFLHLRKG